jgi:hypothetical protein
MGPLPPNPDVVVNYFVTEKIRRETDPNREPDQQTMKRQQRGKNIFARFWHRFFQKRAAPPENE